MLECYSPRWPELLALHQISMDVGTMAVGGYGDLRPELLALKLQILKACWTAGCKVQAGRLEGWSWNAVLKVGFWRIDSL